MLIPYIMRVFKNVLKRPALKNLILVILASLHTKIFQINTLASHLPVNVAHYKTKQKRLLRFINSNFPISIAMEAWCAFVLWQIYDNTGRVSRIMLVDETDILQTIGLSLSLCHFVNGLSRSIGKSTQKTLLTKWIIRAIMCLFKSFVASSLDSMKRLYPMSANRS